MAAGWLATSARTSNRSRESWDLSGCDFAALSNAGGEQVGQGRALSLHLDEATTLEYERRLQALVDGLSHLDSIWKAVGLHPAGEVDRVAPHVVVELLPSD